MDLEKAVDILRATSDGEPIVLARWYRAASAVLVHLAEEKGLGS